MRRYQCRIDSGVIRRQRLNDIFKEAFRKTIHICSAFIPFFLSRYYWPVIILLFAAVTVYSCSELARLHGHEIPVISAVTAVAARKRDENKFVLGPVTLVAGILISALIWDLLPATVGIYALAFGDGLASLAGKLFGKEQIPGTEGKTAAGSLTCFSAIFISTFLVSGKSRLALIAASVGMFIELMPLKDFDNILIPVIVGGLAQFLC